ncbi:MAG: FAD:protein FMN transferase [bacterium]|nr:FAD:protein FMN transferase [bacterium]
MSASSDKAAAARGRVLLKALLLLAALLLLLLPFRQRAFRFTAPAMGTRASVTITDSLLAGLAGAPAAAAGAAFAEIEAVERAVSIFRPGSDIARLNAAPAGAEIELSRLSHEALLAVREAAAMTGGAFNVLVLPAERRWGFKTDARRSVPPDDGPPLPDAAAIVLREDGDRRFASLAGEGMGVDLGGIAKGFAVDRAVEALRSRGVRDAIVEIGGDLRCIGRAPGGAPWRVAVRDPRGGVLAVLEVGDRAVATSGDYEDFFVGGGRRYGHIFDPRTGRPAESGVAGATVIAGSCAMADALATAVVVLGREEGERLVDRLPGVECLIADAEGTAPGRVPPRRPDGNIAAGRGA